jgi:hypothetical protein
MHRRAGMLTTSANPKRAVDSGVSGFAFAADRYFLSVIGGPI